MHTNIIKVPASEKRVTTYTTTDGSKFGYKHKAERHQRAIDSLKIRDALTYYNEWYLVSSQAELEALWLCASDGGWWDSQKEHYISFPSWVQVEAWKDQDRYWHTEIMSLTDGDLRRMIEIGEG